VDVQGYLVEKLSGQPFDEFLQERIFAPLDMVDTAFYVPADKLDRLALIHGENEDGTLTVQQNGDPTQPPAGPSGGGGLYSTTLDYMRFSQMVLNGGALDGVRLLAPRSVEMMRTNHLQEQALSTMAPGSGFGLDFGVVMDPAAAGDVLQGIVPVGRDRRHLVLDRSGRGLRVRWDDSAPRSCRS
jgi:CubicO group peptidase (beta-lactamase class C family)